MDPMYITIRRSILLGFSIALIFSSGVFVGLMKTTGLMIIGIGAVMGLIVGLFTHIAGKITHTKQEGTGPSTSKQEAIIERK